MAEKESNTIRNGIIVTVVGGLILSLVPTLREFFIKIIKYIWAGIVWSYEVVVASYPIPGWLIIIVLPFAIWGVIRLYALVFPKVKPEFLEYTEDLIYGAKWRWHWAGNQVSNLWCYCPRCDAQLVYDDTSVRMYMEKSKTDFICERCNNQVVASISGGAKNYAVGAAEREILRRIRTGEYKNSNKLIKRMENTSS